MASSKELSAAHLLSRIAAGIAGGYCFVLGVTTLGIALGITLGITLGMSYTDAQTLMYLVAFLIYTAAFCWAFIHRSLLTICLLLIGGGGVMTALGWWLGNYA